MKTNYQNAAATGLTLFAAIIGGLAVFTGLNKLIKTKNITDEKMSNKINVNNPNHTKEKPDMNNEVESGNINEKPSSSQIPRNYKQDKVGEVGSKVIRGLQVGQAAISGTMTLVAGIATVAGSIKKILDPDYYKGMMNDPYASTGFFGSQMIPSYAYGDYPWNKRPDPGLPYNTPVYRGQSNEGDDIWWVRKQNNVIEVW